MRPDKTASLSESFNPRLRTGGDQPCGTFGLYCGMFQSTPPVTRHIDLPELGSGIYRKIEKYSGTKTRTGQRDFEEDSSRSGAGGARIARHLKTALTRW